MVGKILLRAMSPQAMLLLMLLILVLTGECI